jgi:small conductance mechanosensitive channel
VLASSAIAAAVVGFAARQMLANAIAGMVLAVTQPLRIGDLVTFEGETGTVEDVTLTYTWLRTGADARLIIPNERLAAGILRNDSIRSDVVALEVSVWLAPDADETAALGALADVEDARVARIAEVTDAGIRLLVAGPPVAPGERIEREGRLRAAALRALREAGCRGQGGEP